VSKMQNKNPNILLHSGNNQGSLDIVKKYYNLIMKKKYWILITIFCVTILWILIYKMFLDKKSEYTSTVTIKFEDNRYRSTAAVTDFAKYGSEGKVAVLHTNSFLSKVVDSLSLNIDLITPGINRFHFFKKMKINENARYGIYKLVRDEGGINVYYTNDDEDIEDLKVQTINSSLTSNVFFNTNGLDMVLNPDIIKQFNEIEFRYYSTPLIVNELKKKLEGTLNYSRTILTLSFTYIHQEAVALITNTIANLFIEELLGHKRFQTSSVLTSLESQLAAAEKELKISEEILRAFREKNPYLLLSNSGSTIVTDISQWKSSNIEVSHKVTRLSNLIKQKSVADPEKQNMIYLELVSFWESENASAAQVMTTQFNNYLNERSRLLSENYSLKHPRMIDIEAKIQNSKNGIDTRVNQYLSQLTSIQRKTQSDIYRNQRNLNRLPEGEMKLAELQQDKQVKANIYSNILIRYNEAKIADASIIPDAFIIDRAQVPIVYTSISDKLILLAIGPLLGLFVAIGLFVALDYFDASVKGKTDVETKLKLPVLTSIPVIIDEKEYPNDLEAHRQLEPKLITSDYAPSIAGEKFRLVRTKLLLENRDQKKSIIVSSLSPGDGKSLISSNLAITFAQQKVPTVLIDSDLRRGVLHNSFSCEKKPGLADILVSTSRINLEAISKITKKTHIPNLFLISSGIQVPNPSELLGSDRMRQVISALEQKYGVIILDTPPIEFIPDTLIINSFVHNILLVARYGKTNINRLSEKVSGFSNISEDFVGVVINASSDPEEKDDYSYSYYHY